MDTTGCQETILEIPIPVMAVEGATAMGVEMAERVGMDSMAAMVVVGEIQGLRVGTVAKAETVVILRPTTAVVVMGGKGVMAKMGVVTAVMEETARTVTQVTVAKVETGLVIRRAGTVVMVVIQKLMKVATVEGVAIQMVRAAQERVEMVEQGTPLVGREVSQAQPIIATLKKVKAANDTKKV